MANGAPRGIHDSKKIQAPQLRRTGEMSPIAEAAFQTAWPAPNVSGSSLATSSRAGVRRPGYRAPESADLIRRNIGTPLRNTRLIFPEKAVA